MSNSCKEYRKSTISSNKKKNKILLCNLKLSFRPSFVNNCFKEQKELISLI